MCLHQSVYAKCDDVKLMFIDARTAQFKAKIVTKEEWVGLQNKFKNFGVYAKLKEMVGRDEPAASTMGE